MGSGSLLKAIMGPVEVKILLSLGGWLSHGQSCHISYFYMSRNKKAQHKIKVAEKQENNNKKQKNN